MFERFPGSVRDAYCLNVARCRKGGIMLTFSKREAILKEFPFIGHALSEREWRRVEEFHVKRFKEETLDFRCHQLERDLFLGDYHIVDHPFWFASEEKDTETGGLLCRKKERSWLDRLFKRSIPTSTQTVWRAYQHLDEEDQDKIRYVLVLYGAAATVYRIPKNFQNLKEYREHLVGSHCQKINAGLEKADQQVDAGEPA